MGPRTLRTDTACVALLAIVHDCGDVDHVQASAGVACHHETNHPYRPRIAHCGARCQGCRPLRGHQHQGCPADPREDVTALEKQDAAGAKAAFEAYDSGWNGIEVYINVRSADMYAALEKNFQTRITEGLKAPKPDIAKLLPDVKAMLAKYDEMIAMVEKGKPLNRLYDDVARLRIVRAHLREVTPALKAGDIAKARKSFGAFNDTWDNIEQLIKERSADAYVAIESGMIKIERGAHAEGAECRRGHDIGRRRDHPVQRDSGDGCQRREGSSVQVRRGKTWLRPRTPGLRALQAPGLRACLMTAPRRRERR